MRNQNNFSPFWFITLLAIAAGGYLSWQWFVKQGPEITISFTDASGIVPGDTGIYYHGARIGKVTRISLDKPPHILVTAQMQATADSLLNEGTEIWISRPELGLEGIRNLSTIASGSTIELNPGSGKPARHFTALEEAPPSGELATGLKVILKAPKLGSIAVGTPVTYRDLKTGEVIKLELSDNADSVLVTAMLYRKYAKLIQENTQFWNAGGLQTKIHIFGGSKVSIPSLSSLVSGKIAFTNQQKGKAAKHGQVFPLLPEVPEKPKKSSISMPWEQDNSTDPGDKN